MCYHDITSNLLGVDKRDDYITVRHYANTRIPVDIQAVVKSPTLMFCF